MATLLRAALLCSAAVPHAPGCSDPAATNFDPATSPTASAYNNSGCAYTCAELCAHFALSCPPARTLCVIDSAGPGGNWSHDNATLFASLGSTLIIQGHVTAGDLSCDPSLNSSCDPGRSQLRGRIAGAVTGGATVILRHTAMVGLHARSGPLGNLGDGGAVSVLNSNLTIEHCLFAHNEVSKNDEFCIKNAELCIKHEELCIKNDEFCRPTAGALSGRPGWCVSAFKMTILQ